MFFYFEYDTINHEITSIWIFPNFTTLGTRGTQKWPKKGKNVKNGPDKPFYLFFSVFRRPIHMFFIFEYDTKNHEVSFSIWIIPNFTALGTWGTQKWPEKGKNVKNKPDKPFYLFFFQYLGGQNTGFLLLNMVQETMKILSQLKFSQFSLP